MRLNLCMVNDHLHEGELPDERVAFIVDVLHRCEEHIELLELVPGCDPSLNCDVEVVNGPAPQVLHPSLPVRVVVDEGAQFGPLVKQVFPVGQFLGLRDHEEGPVDLVLELEAAEETYEGDALSQPLLVSQNLVPVLEEGLFEAIEAPLLEVEQLEVLALQQSFFAFLVQRFYLVAAALLRIALEEGGNELVK